MKCIVYDVHTIQQTATTDRKRIGISLLTTKISQISNILDRSKSWMSH